MNKRLVLFLVLAITIGCSPAVLAAKAIKRVRSVEWLDLGVPEAMWVFEVSEFGPLLVAVDSHGNNLFKDVADRAEANKQLVYRRLGL